MAASIPEGTWIFIVILAVIILAILSNDSISRRSSSSSTSSSSSSSGDSSSSDSTNRPPSINGYHTGDEYVGGSFGVRGNFSAGGASDYELEASINGSAVDIDTNGQSFRTEEANVQRGENHYKVKIQTSAGQDEDRGSFPSTQQDPDSSRNPRVRVTEQRVSPTGDFRLEAMAESRSDADIALTGFVKLTHTRGSIFDFSSLEDSDKVSPGRQHVLEGSIPTSDGNIAAGTVHYKAKTKDTEGRTGTYQDSFSFERGISGDNSASGGGSGGSVEANVTYGGSDSGTGDGSGSSSSSDAGDSSTGGDDGSGGDSDGSDINSGDNIGNMGVREHLGDGRELTELRDMEKMITRLEQFDEQEIKELERIQKIVAAAELSLQMARDHNVEREGDKAYTANWEEIEKDVAASDYLLNQLNEEIGRFETTDKRMEELKESFEDADKKISSEIDALRKGVLSELNDHHPAGKEVEANVEKHYSSESVQEVVNEVFDRAGESAPSLPDID
jgi:hypothetical protein